VARAITLILEAKVESEKPYEEVFENANDIIYTHDLEGRYTSLNRKGREITGYTFAEAATIESAKVASAEDMALAMKMLKSKIDRKTTEPTVYELEIFAKDGRRIPLEVSSQLLFKNGQPFSVLGIARDITARRESQAALQLANQELKKANERAGEESKILASTISNLAQTLTSARDLSQVFDALVTFTNNAIPCDTILLALYNEERNEALPRFLCTEGTEIVLQDPKPIELQQGPAGLAVLSKQIVITNNLSAAAIKENQSSLNPQQNGHYPIVSIMSVPIRTAEKIVGLLEIQTSEPGAYTDEHKIPIANAANLVANAIENIRLIARDQERERQLHKAQKIEAIGHLSAHVAHDFNNILTVIYGWLDLLNTELPVGHELRPHVIQIRECARRAQHLCSQLLGFGRRQMLQPQTRDLNKLIRHNTKNFLPHIIGDDIAIDTWFDQKLPFAYIDQSQFEQIIMNLAVNARDAMPNGGTITIQTKRIDPGHPQHSRRKDIPEILLTFSDTGVGIKPEIQKQIFEPYFTTKDEGKGTGLGLAMISGSIAQIGGTVTVKSTVGQGTTFSLQFPAAEDQREPAPPKIKRAKQRHHTSQGILVAEDDERVRETVVASLKSAGYSVLAARNGREALDLLTTSPEVQLLLTDLLMPEMNGNDLATKARAIIPEIKILFMSGYSTEEITNEEILANDMALINKPFSPPDLLDKVRDVFDLQTVRTSKAEVEV
jgi:PAS domain S-box-containing protein